MLGSKSTNLELSPGLNGRKLHDLATRGVALGARVAADDLELHVQGQPHLDGLSSPPPG